MTGRFRFLPWDYGVRNLLRRPTRTLLAGFALAVAVLLVLAVAGFVRGLEGSLGVSGDPRVVLVHAPGAGDNLEGGVVPARIAPELAAAMPHILRRFGQPYVSPELFLGSRVTAGDADPALGLVRGITPAVHLVRRSAQLAEGRWPGPGEVAAGRLAAAKLGLPGSALAVGSTVALEGRTWTVSGRFVAAGAALESEIWCPLDELQAAMRRQDVTLVALTLAPGSSFADVDEFCKGRLDLEIQATAEADYYAGLQRYYAPVKAMAWLVAWLVAGAGIFAGMNVMYGSVMGRVRELATLQVIGFTRRAVLASLVQEAALLAAAAALLATAFALLFLDGLAVRFTMGAFALRIDGPAILLGCGAGLLVGVLGALPPAWAAMRLSLPDGLKSI